MRVNGNILQYSSFHSNIAIFEIASSYLKSVPFLKTHKGQAAKPSELYFPQEGLSETSIPVVAGDVSPNTSLAVFLLRLGVKEYPSLEGNTKNFLSFEHRSISLRGLKGPT